MTDNKPGQESFGGSAAPSQKPILNNIFEVSADFLGELRLWLEQNPPAIGIRSIIGFKRSTAGAQVLGTTFSVANDGAWHTINTFFTDPTGYDTDGFLTANDRFTIPAGLGGKYAFTFSADWSAAVTNGAARIILGGSNIIAYCPSVGVISGGATATGGAGIYAANAGDIIQVQAFHQTAGPPSIIPIRFTLQLLVGSG